jgi:tetraacyldisaccharide 4'-kinase
VAADHAVLRGKLVWRVKRQIAIPQPPPSPIVFCGIARPQLFFAQVRALGIASATEVVFRDHQRYQRSDITRLLDAKAKSGAGGFVTTEKDGINLGPLAEQLQPLAFAVLNVMLDNADDLVDTILGRIGK